MGLALQDLGIDQLPVDQRVKRAQEIWDSIAHEMGVLPPTPGERAEDRTPPCGRQGVARGGFDVG